MKKNETMRGLCLLLAMVMVLSLMPMSVLAVDATDSDVPEQPTGTVVYINGQDVTTIDEGDDTISWDAETKTLTLNNASILAQNGTHKGSGIYVVGNDTVVLELQGESTVEGQFNGRVENSYEYVDDIFANAAISTVGNLVIRGEGTLNATDLAVEDKPARSAGIYAGGELTIESGLINATGGSAYNSVGIISGDYDSWGEMKVTGGTVNATGDTCGLAIHDSLYISGGTVNAISKSESDGCGIKVSADGGFEFGGVYISGGTTTMSGSGSAVEGLLYVIGYGLYQWTDSPDGVPQYSDLPLMFGKSPQYLRIEPSDYQFIVPNADNRFTADMLAWDGEAWGPLPENAAAEYKWYRYNERFLTGEDFDETTAIYVTYDDAADLWNVPIDEDIATGGMYIAADVGDVITVTIPQKPSGILFVVSMNTEQMFTENSNGVFTHTVTEADLDPETGLFMLYLISKNELQYTLSLSDTEEIQTAADKPNQFISDIAGKYMCTATVYQDGALLGTFTSDPFAYTYTGWKEIKDEDGNVLGNQFILDHVPQYSGWTQFDGAWYYIDPDTGYRTEGITRVPYPTEAINGVTYAPDQESIDYAASKGQTFIDETTGLFWFDTDGKFLSSYTGIVPSEDGPSQYAVNGHIAWHVGLVQVGEDYYYFIGNSEIGGNKMATGDIYAGRNTTDFDMVVGGVYTFGEDGKLCKYDGIVDLRYYENYRLMIGNGLTKVDGNYIYVNSKGELIVDAEYYVPGNDLGIASGTYYFDENGFMTQPVSIDKDGVYFENGAWYYYVDGKIAYNKGLIFVNTTWHGADSSENVYSGYIYVRSSGKLATGTYYITNVSNDASGLFTLGMKVLFDENGIADAPKNGIHEIDGNLYYFVGNQIQYNAGLIMHNGGWIYVRSSGKLATGAYWITNTNGNLDAGMYEFGADGYMIVSDIEDGIVDENGVLYYYLDGKKQYGIGLRQLEDGTFIYVRTNGELATGSYWITNHNGLLPEGMYEFDADGIMIEN